MAERSSKISDRLGTVSTLATVGLIALMLLIPYSKGVDPQGVALAMFLKYSNFFWGAYITVQVLESATRDYTKIVSYLLDNLLAGAAFVVGLLVLTGPLAWRALDGDQQRFLFEGLQWTLVDIITGLLIPIVIAGSWKERNEVRS